MATKRQLEPRDALRLIAPGPVHLLSTMYHDHPNLMAAGWVVPLGFEPTLIGVAVHPSRLSHEFATRSEVFALNVPTADLIAAVHACGMTSGREADKFATTGLTPADAQEIEAPLVAECVAHIECGLVDRHAFGDHDLFVGRVLNVLALDEAFDGFWNGETDAGQLLHHLGADRYAGLGRAYRIQPPAEE